MRLTKLKFMIVPTYETKIEVMDEWFADIALMAINFTFSRHYNSTLGMASVDLQLTYLRGKYCL